MNKKTPPPHFRRRGRSWRPRVEQLEDRCLLAVNALHFTGLSIADGSILPNNQTPPVNYLSGANRVPPDTILVAGANAVIEVVNSSIVGYQKSDPTQRPLQIQSLEHFFSRTDNGLNGSSIATGNLTGNCYRPGTNADPDCSKNRVFDSVVAYDELTHRFIVASLEEGRNPVSETIGGDTFWRPMSFLSVAISGANDDLTTWQKGRINVAEVDPVSTPNGFLADRDFIGWNGNAYVFTIRMFTMNATNYRHGTFSAGITFHHVQLVTLDKNNPFTNIQQTNLDDVTTGTTVYTLAPSTMHLPQGSTGGLMWFLGNAGTAGTVTLFRIGDVRNTSTGDFRTQQATLGTGIGSFDAPPYAVGQGGTSRQLDTSSHLVLSAAWRNERLVGSQTVGRSSRTFARWFEFNTDPTLPTPTLTQKGEVSPDPGQDSTTVNTYFPAIDINRNGDLGVTFMESRPAGPSPDVGQYLSMYVTSQRNGATAGTVQVPTRVRGGEAGYDNSGEPTGAMQTGDYGGLAFDPSSPGLFWAGHEFAVAEKPLLASPPLAAGTRASANWATEISKLTSFAPQNAIDQTFTDLTGNPANQGDINYWLPALTSGQEGVYSLADGVISSDRFRHDQIGDYFNAYLRRAAIPSDLNYWNDRLTGAQQPRITLEQLRSEIIGSPEYFNLSFIHQDNGLYVDSVYQDVLGHAPDAAGRQYWLNQLAGGASRTSVALGIVQSNEGMNRVIDGWYVAFLGRNGQMPELDYWRGQILSGALRSEDAIRAIYKSDEHLSRAAIWII